MAKKTLLTIDGTYKKVRNGFITIDNTYHKIKKAFITIGGVYRPCWGQDPIEYYGKLNVLAMKRRVPTTYSFNGSAVFAGGIETDKGSPTTRVEIFTGLTMTTRTLGTARNSMAAASNTTYLLLAGGHSGTAEATYNKVDAFNKSFTRYNGTNLGFARTGLGGSSAGSYMIFAGGYTNYNDPVDSGSGFVDCYSSYNSRSSLTSITYPTWDYVYGASAEDTAIFFVSRWHLYAYTNKGICGGPTHAPRYDSSCKPISYLNYAVFAGVANISNDISKGPGIFYCTKDLTYRSLPDLPISISGVAVLNDLLVVIGDGRAYYYDKDFVRTLITSSLEDRDTRASSTGDLVICLGGDSSTVEVLKYMNIQE